MGERIIGNRVYSKVVKNKVAPPFKVAEFDIMYNEGISYTGDLVDQGLKYKLIQKSGSWLSYGDIKLGQGREAAKQMLRDDLKLAKQLEKAIWEAAEREDQEQSVS
jgi:recombination protein RecA